MLSREKRPKNKPGLVELPEVLDSISSGLVSQLVVSEVMPFGVRLVAEVAGEPRLVSMVEKHVLAQQSLAEKHVRTGGALPAEVGMALHQVLLDSHHADFHHLNSRSLLNMAALFRKDHIHLVPNCTCRHRKISIQLDCTWDTWTPRERPHW